MKSTKKNQLMMYMLGEVLSKKYMEGIREQEGGSYGVSVISSFLKLPNRHCSLQIRFDCNPDKDDKLLAMVYQEIQALQQQPISALTVEDIKKNILKSHEEAVKSNNYWLAGIVKVVRDKDVFTNSSDFKEIVNKITPEDLEIFAKRVFGASRAAEVVMKPKA